MASDVIATLSLSPILTKDSLMQAVGRLRKIGRNQKVIIAITKEIERKLQNFGFKETLNVHEKVKIILNWTCFNSVKENQKFFIHNSNLAAIHLTNLKDKNRPSMNKIDTSLKKMYEKKIN